MKKINPPKWADKFLEWYCSEKYVEEVQGDLHEWFYKRVNKKGQRNARLYFWLDVTRYLKIYRVKSLDAYH